MQSADGRFRAFVNGVQVWNVGNGICDLSYTIDARGLGGADAINISFVLPQCEPNCLVDGGSGNDTLNVSGCADADTIGGDGNDHFYLGTSSRLYNGSADGESGTDYFCYHADNAFLYGGPGSDSFGTYEGGCQEIYSGIVSGEETGDFFWGGDIDSHNAYFHGGAGGDIFTPPQFGSAYFSYISCDSLDFLLPGITYGTLSGCSPD